MQLIVADNPESSSKLKTYIEKKVNFCGNVNQAPGIVEKELD